MVVRLLEYPPCLEAYLMISWRYLAHCILSFPLDWIAQVVRALDLVGGANIAVISLDLLTRLMEVTEDLAKNNNVGEASSWVGTLEPH